MNTIGLAKSVVLGAYVGVALSATTVAASEDPVGVWDLEAPANCTLKLSEHTKRCVYTTGSSSFRVLVLRVYEDSVKRAALDEQHLLLLWRDRQRFWQVFFEDVLNVDLPQDANQTVESSGFLDAKNLPGGLTLCHQRILEGSDKASSEIIAEAGLNITSGSQVKVTTALTICVEHVEYSSTFQLLILELSEGRLAGKGPSDDIVSTLDGAFRSLHHN